MPPQGRRDRSKKPDKKRKRELSNSTDKANFSETNTKQKVEENVNVLESESISSKPGTSCYKPVENNSAELNSAKLSQSRGRKLRSDDLNVMNEDDSNSKGANSKRICVKRMTGNGSNTKGRNSKTDIKLTHESNSLTEGSISTTVKNESDTGTKEIACKSVITGIKDTTVKGSTSLKVIGGKGNVSKNDSARVMVEGGCSSKTGSLNSSSLEAKVNDAASYSKCVVGDTSKGSKNCSYMNKTKRKDESTLRTNNVDKKKRISTTKGNSISTRKTGPIAKTEDLVNPSHASITGVKYASNYFKSTKNCDGLVSRVKGKSIVHNFFNFQETGGRNPNSSYFRQQVLLAEISQLSVLSVRKSFERRCTALSWHPVYPVFAAASKGGEVIFTHASNVDLPYEMPGIGPGGSILALHTSSKMRSSVYVASMCGFFSVLNFEKRAHSNILTIECNDYSKWYSSMHINEAEDLALVGDTTGMVNLTDLKNNSLLWSRKLHRDKILHAEFNKRDSNLIVTASRERTVKIWDLRKLNNKDDFIVSLDHDKPVSSSTFSLTDGCRLLTTDQHAELRVYRSPLWHLEKSIHHPHRFFQHITPIKAAWHPLEDVIVCGRYPDPKLLDFDLGFKCIDLIDAKMGKFLYEIPQEGITSLAQFSSNGRFLLSTSGCKLHLRA